MEQAREGETKKTSFAPSGLGYASGSCPRRWVLAFRGTEAENVTKAAGFHNMEVGRDRHERIQKALEAYPDVTKHIEYELIHDDPPVHGYVDGILEFEGFPIILEIKTTRAESFYSKLRTGKANDYHMIQILLYMYLLKIDRGVFLYENKNDGSRLYIKVAMNDYNKERIELILEWMRTVYKAFEDDKLPERPYKKSSAICKGCIFKKACWGIDDKEQVLIQIDPLPKVFS